MNMIRYDDVIVYFALLQKLATRQTPMSPRTHARGRRQLSGKRKIITWATDGVEKLGESRRKANELILINYY